MAERPGGSRPAGRRRLVFRAVAVVVLAGLLVLERRLIASSFQVIGHVKWIWLVLALELESASMASVARLQRRLLRVGEARVRLFPVMATVYAGNALSATVPFAGAQLGARFAFRRFKQLGVDGPVAAWTLLTAGVISYLASAVLLSVGAILTGNDIVAATGGATAVGTIVALVLTTAAVRCPAVMRLLAGPVSSIVLKLTRLMRRPVSDPAEVLARLIRGIRLLRLRPFGWVIVVGVAFVNWLADVGVLAVSLHAVGAPVPWRGLLFAYAVGTAAAGIGLTPGGIGVVEGALAFALMGVGVRHPLALAAVLVYRLISFWTVVSLGWIAYLFLARSSTQPAPAWNPG